MCGCLFLWNGCGLCWYIGSASVFWPGVSFVLGLLVGTVLSSCGWSDGEWQAVEICAIRWVDSTIDVNPVWIVQPCIFHGCISRRNASEILIMHSTVRGTLKDFKV